MYSKDSIEIQNFNSNGIILTKDKDKQEDEYIKNVEEYELF